MEYRSRTETHAKMVRWRDVDAPTIERWVEASKCRQGDGITVFVAGCRKARKPRRFAATQGWQRERDRRYTFNSA